MGRSRKVRHWFEYQAVRGALALAGSLPIGVARAIGASVGRLAFALGVRRDVSVDNITASLGVDRKEAATITRRSYENLGRSVMEFSAFRRWSREELLSQVIVDGKEHLERARSAGHGGMVVAGHFGCWELAGATIAALGYPTSFLVGEQSNLRVDEVMNDLRRAQGVGIITRTSALRKVLTALRGNEFVALLADQDARKGGVIVDFLGRPASVVRGPALFAIRAKSPVIPLFIHREGRRHRVIFEAPLWPDPSMGEDAAVEDLTRRHADALARRIREHPEEYFWPHRRWKTGLAQAVKSQQITVSS